MPRVLLLDLLDRPWYGATMTQWLVLRRFHSDQIEFGYSTRTLQLRSAETTSSSPDSSA